MEIPNWNIVGSVMVSQNQIRLTPDIQSRSGALWSRIVNYIFDNMNKFTNDC